MSRSRRNNRARTAPRRAQVERPVERPPIERVRMLAFVAILPALLGLVIAGVTTGDKLYFYIASLLIVAGLVMTWVIDMMRKR